jgi:hypothetical protein
MFYSLIITAKEHIDLPTLLPPSTSLSVEVGRWTIMNLKAEASMDKSKDRV